MKELWVAVIVVPIVIGVAVAGFLAIEGAATPTSTGTVIHTSTSAVVQSTSYSAEPIQVLGPSMARLNPETDLNLSLNLVANANRSITVAVSDVNTLPSQNNVTVANDWPTTSVSVCSYPDMVSFAIYQGDYSAGNYTQGTPFYYGNVGTCLPASYAIFSPLSSQATFDKGTQPFVASISRTLSGFDVGGNSSQPFFAFVPFPPGIYTIAAVDEWGNIVTSQFKVNTPYGTATTFGVLTTLTQTQFACENAKPGAMPNSGACIDLYGWAFVYSNSTVTLDLATQQGLAASTTELNITFSGLPGNAGFTGSVSLDKVVFPNCSCPFDERITHSPVLPNLKQGDQVKVEITGTSGLLFTTTFVIGSAPYMDENP